MIKHSYQIDRTTSERIAGDFVDFASTLTVFSTGNHDETHYRLVDITQMAKRANFYIKKEIRDLQRLNAIGEFYSVVELHDVGLSNEQAASLRFVLGGGESGTTTYVYTVVRTSDGYLTPKFSFGELLLYLIYG